MNSLQSIPINSFVLVELVYFHSIKKRHDHTNQRNCGARLLFNKVNNENKGAEMENFEEVWNEMLPR